MRNIALFVLMSASLFANWFVSDPGQTNLKATITIVTGAEAFEIWDGDSFEANPAYADRAITVTATAGNPYVYTYTIPAGIDGAGTLLVLVYQTGDGTLDSADTIIDKGGAFTIDWDGTVEVWNNTLNTAIADVPTVTEFNARTLVAANYFNPANTDVTVGSFNTDSSDTLTLGGVTLASSSRANGVFVVENTGSTGPAVRFTSSNGAGVTSSGVCGLIVTGSSSDFVGQLSADSLDLTTLATAWANGGRLDLILDAVHVKAGGGRRGPL